MGQWTGIIPAYAGNTYVQTSDINLTGDHPRVCGEHLNTVGVIGTTVGSSPRMRGTQDKRHYCRQHTGIIPAYAGNTEGTLKRLVIRGDHPRVCGEHHRA